MKTLTKLIEELEGLPLEEKIEAINQCKKELHQVSPFSNEPVDCVLWVKQEQVEANDYNPNSVAPPEMELLHTSISHDGYTQPIVANKEEQGYTVVDGFHRNRVAREYDDIKEQMLGYLPIVEIRDVQSGRNDRIASTIRHNRARGKHKVAAMADIVLELKRRNWSDKKIGKELGMDADEVLRLAQITGLAEAFADQEFSMSWEAQTDELEVENESVDSL